MAKLTSEMVSERLSEIMVDLSPEAMEVKTGKGKKAKVDAEATYDNVYTHLLYSAGLLAGMNILAEAVEGANEVMAEAIEEYNALFTYAEENYPEQIEALTEEMGISLIETDSEEDEEEEEDEENGSPLDGLELADLKKVAKELGAKVVKKDTEETLIEKIEEYDEEDIHEALVALGLIEEEDEDEEEDEEEETEEEEYDYSEMSLAELRAECKERGIKYTPKEKADDLIAKLEDWDEENSDEEDEDGDGEELALEDLDIDSLKALAKELGMKAPKLKKADEEALIAFIQEQDEEAVSEAMTELFGDDEEADEDEEEEEIDEEEEEEEEEEAEADYSEMSLGELRKLCKERGIKWTPKEKADDLIAKLEESDEAEADDEEDDEEQVDEHKLDEILDEEFEDEVLEQEEKATKNKKGGKVPPKRNKR